MNAERALMQAPREQVLAMAEEHANEAATAGLTSQLRDALAARAVIDQAIGVIMAQERCTPAAAFAILRTASQNRNVKLRAIATQVVTSVTGQPPQPPAPFDTN